MAEKFGKERVVVLDGYTLNPGDLSWNGFAEIGDLTVYDRTDPDEVIDRIKEATIVLTNKTALSEVMLKSAPKLRYIGVLATGYNVVDTAAAAAAGITVTNIPSYGTMAVAQMTIALLLEICHHTAHHSEAVFKGEWARRKDYCFWDYPLIELDQKVFGIIGYGRIGRQAAKIARALGMKVIAYSRSAKDPEIVSLDRLYSEADIISLHCPLTAETDKIINDQSISKMKNNVIIINTARGQLIDEEALASGLNRGKVYAAGLDVVSLEPIRPDNPLLQAKNCFITPHISWAPKESRQRLMEIAVNNLKQYLTGKPDNLVT
ncbi:MAG: D-2-hydroxyacid dehydrogenase [Firmicutes bacterium]|nr:D-2-hydroxyacid dehydrogenase [Bacillota bacterium]